MRRVLARVLTLLTIGGTLVVFAVAVRANSGWMAQLPVSAPFGCANCHAGATSNSVPPDHALNAFGSDFKNYGLAWNATLANLDSDNDGCTNGTEIGDADGNGHADANVTQENSNPGVPDCTNQASEKTWGELKSLFDNH